MRTVRRLRDEQRHADPFTEPAVCGDAELAHRFLVPGVAGFGEGPAHVDRVGQVEAGRAVVHQRHGVADMSAQLLAQLGVRAGIAPRVELDGGVTGVQALVGDVEILLHTGERDRTGVGGKRVAVRAEQAVHRHTGGLPRDVPQGDVDQSERIYRKLFNAVELPQPVPEQLTRKWVVAQQVLTDPPFDEVGHDEATPSVGLPSRPSSVWMRRTPPVTDFSDPGRPLRQRNGGCAGRSTSSNVTSVIRILSFMSWKRMDQEEASWSGNIRRRSSRWN